jgi:hypothetical protein
MKGSKRLISDEHKRKLIKIQKAEKNYNWKGGRIKSYNYILIHNPQHPFCNSLGYIREHRLIAEKYLGRYLTKVERIHHINNIKFDNRPENLYLFSNEKEHRAYHNLKNKLNLISNITKSPF